jgi:hypothetical protein
MEPKSPEELDASNWDRCTDLVVYANYFDAPHLCPKPPDDRKFRLLAVAALRAVWDHILDPRSRAAIDMSEDYADDPSRIARDTYEDALRVAGEAEEAERSGHARDELHRQVSLAAFQVAALPMRNLSIPAYWVEIVTSLESSAIPGRLPTEARRLHLSLFHDVIENPFRPVPFDPAWRTTTTIGLAERMYESRDFGAMPILADALEDAGCDSADALAHCRGAGPHVRGCWAVDLVLGKS